MSLTSLILRPSFSVPSGTEILRGTLGQLNGYIREPEFKRVLNQILFAQAEQNFKSIAVVSELSGEGKTFFVSALALAYSKFLNSRVLIIDTTRQSKRRSLYLECILGQHLPASGGVQIGGVQPGFVDLISGDSLEAGEYDSADFHMAPFINEMGHKYDVVLVDTAAISTAGADSIDPLIVGQVCDRAVLLTSPESLRRDTIKQTAVNLKRFRVQVLGTTFNNGATQ